MKVGEKSLQEAKFGEGSISSFAGFKDDFASFQISAPAQPGNSGGPLVNAQRDVIGIVVAKLRSGELGNYGIKSSTALILLEHRAPPFPGETVFVETAGTAFLI